MAQVQTFQRQNEAETGLHRGGQARVGLVYFAIPPGSLTGTCGEELTTLGLPSEWAWLRISDSKSRKNFSASMAQPRKLWLFALAAAKSTAIQSLPRERRFSGQNATRTLRLTFRFHDVAS
jgi:hypothetical protein